MNADEKWNAVITNERRYDGKFFYGVRSTFQKKVWDALQNIPYGETQSYQQIAQMIGNDKASRAAQGAKIESPRNCSRAIIAVTYTRAGRERKIFLLPLPIKAVSPRCSG